MPPTRRAYLAATGGLAAALAGCSSGTDSGTNDSAATNEPTDTAGTQRTSESKSSAGGVLKLALPSKLDSLDPISGTAFGNGYVQLYEGLMTFPDGDTDPKHALATGHEVSEDRKTYTFELKKGVSFHDGRSLTASDFVYSWKRLAGSDHSNNANNIIGDTFTVKHERTDDGRYVPDSLAVEAVDPHTFRFELDEPFPSTLSLLADPSLAVIPEGIVGDIEGYEGRKSYRAFSTDPVGTGPFEFERRKSGVAVALSAFPDYHGTGPVLDGIHWQVLPNATARYQSATAGNLDVFSIPTTRFDPEKVTIETRKPDGRALGTYGPIDGDTLKYGRVPNLTTQYITLNTDRIDRPARRAIAYTLNQQQILKQVFKGLGTPAYFITPKAVFPGGPDTYEQQAKANYPYGYDESRIEEAKRVMEHAGYDADNRYEVVFTVYQNSAWKRIATLLRDKLTAAHIDLTIQQIAFSTVLTRAADGKIDMFSFADSLEWPAADNLLRYLHPSSKGFSRWRGTESAKRAEDAWETYLHNRGRGKKAQNARNRAYRTIEKANWDAVAELPVRHGVEQRFWYDWANVPMYGPMLSQQYTTAELDKRS